MSSNKPRNPNIDFGFHAVIPRIVRTSYKHLTHAQKWLYTCLKDLCGDSGTCYRSLRALSEETDMSTGLLSESIPVLHKAGLIHAVLKKRSSGGKPVWHITIVDIWQANAKAHPTKRSQNEQSQEECSQNEQTTTDTDTDVHKMNENVQNVNKDRGECSQNEQECSQNETEAITIGNNNSKVITMKDSVVLSDDEHNEAHHMFEHLHQEEKTPSGSCSQNEEAEKPAEEKEKRKRGSRKPKPPKPPKETESEELRGRIEKMFDCLDELAQETSGDPEFGYDRKPQTVRDAIKDLLNGRQVTPAKMRMVYMEMWNSPAGKDGFEWKNNMSVKAVCNHYDEKLLAALAKQKSAASSQSKKDEQSASPSRYTRLAPPPALKPIGGAR
jgi:hypothetical protein